MAQRTDGVEPRGFPRRQNARDGGGSHHGNRYRNKSGRVENVDAIEQAGSPANHHAGSQKTNQESCAGKGQTAAKYHGDNCRPGCAERHADAHLRRAQPDGVHQQEALQIGSRERSHRLSPRPLFMRAPATQQGRQRFKNAICNTSFFVTSDFSSQSAFKPPALKTWIRGMAPLGG